MADNEPRTTAQEVWHLDRRLVMLRADVADLSTAVARLETTAAEFIGKLTH